MVFDILNKAYTVAMFAGVGMSYECGVSPCAKPPVSNAAGVLCACTMGAHIALMTRAPGQHNGVTVGQILCLTKYLIAVCVGLAYTIFRACEVEHIAVSRQTPVVQAFVFHTQIAALFVAETRAFGESIAIGVVKVG